MLNEEQQATEVTITGGQVIIALQVISRLVSSGGLKDMELSPVGDARDGMVAALETATGVNFDTAKAQQEAMQRQRIAQARADHQKAQQEAVEMIDGIKVEIYDHLDRLTDPEAKLKAEKYMANNKSRIYNTRC